MELPPLAVSVIKAGPRKPIDAIIPTAPRESRDGVTPGAVEYRYDIGVFEQRLQLDLWAEKEVDLQDLESQLDTALNAGQSVTLGARRGPVRDGALLALLSADGHEGFADFTVLDGPDEMVGAERNIRHEWRATYRVQMTVVLSIWVEHVRQLRVILSQKIGVLPDGEQPQDTIIDQT